MKTNTHKIRNTPRETCTAEQKIAYNLASTYGHLYEDEFREAANQSPEAAAEKARFSALDIMSRFYSGDPRWNVAAVTSALLHGLGGYMARPFIATDYAAVGAAFPL